MLCTVPGRMSCILSVDDGAHQMMQKQAMWGCLERTGDHHSIAYR